jgi:hypothetical protein
VLNRNYNTTSFASGLTYPFQQQCSDREAEWAPRRYPFQEGQIVDLRSLQISNLQRQKNKPFLEGCREGEFIEPRFTTQHRQQTCSVLRNLMKVIPPLGRF